MDQDQDQDQDQANPECSSTETAGTTVAVRHRPLFTRDLGWSEAEIEDTHHRLRPFEPDWDATGMDAYDDL